MLPTDSRRVAVDLPTHPRARSVCTSETMRRHQAESLRGDIRVLVPGAGLARLAFDVAHLGEDFCRLVWYNCYSDALDTPGFASQGNEFSHYMLLASHFILNRYEPTPWHRRPARTHSAPTGHPRSTSTLFTHSSTHSRISASARISSARSKCPTSYLRRSSVATFPLSPATSRRYTGRTVTRKSRNTDYGMR